MNILPKTKAFTLIELMVVITIMGIIGVSVYAPYQYYQTKQKVKNSAKIVSQTLYEARNLAINGLETGGGNTSMGVFFKKGESKLEMKTSGVNYKEIPLEPGVEVVQVAGKDEALFEYSAIFGTGSYTDTSGVDLPMSLPSPLHIIVGFKGSSTGTLSQTIDYYPGTYISDIP